VGVGRNLGASYEDAIGCRSRSADHGTQTMVLTWLILGVGVVLIALALPGVLPVVRGHGSRGHGLPAA
jgi:hypothetical protein